jgi:uncharacterized protein
MHINDGLTSLVTGMGTDRDKSESVTYTLPTHDRTQEYVAAYRTSWLARRVVDQVAEDCFRKGRAWQAEADQISRIEATEKRIGWLKKSERAFQLGRLYGEAYLYISIKGDEDRTDEPLDPRRAKNGGISRIVLLTKNEIAEGPIQTDPLQDGYGEPQYYEVMSTAELRRIHPSRLVKFKGKELPQDYVFGSESESVLASTLPAIKRYDSIIHNVSGMTHDARVRILYIQNLAKLLEDSEGETQVLTRARVFNMGLSNMSMGLLDAGDPNISDDKGERLDQSTTSFATLPDVIEKAQEDASAAARMPRAILFGTGAGGLGATGDLELSAYYDYVNTLQSNELQPAMSVLDECIIWDALGARPAEIHYNWNSLWQQSDKERAELADKISSSVQKLISSGAIPAEVMTQSVINAFTENGVFPGLEGHYWDWIDAGGTLGEEGQEEDNDINPATA